jgi:cysteine synthase A
VDGPPTGPDSPRHGGRGEDAAGLHELWQEIAEAVASVVDRTTLDDLRRRALDRRRATRPMYHITASTEERDHDDQAARAPSRPRWAGAGAGGRHAAGAPQSHSKPGGATVLAKLESLNPGGSVRIASLAMVEDAKRLVLKGATLVGHQRQYRIGLAMVCAVRGYRLILTMPDDMSAERQRLLARYGAEIHLTPAIEGMTGAVFAAQEICREHPDYFMPLQFENPMNPEAHRRTTALEILDATDERLDVFVAAVGTGGTVTGVGEVLKARLPGVRVVGVEPARSPVLSGGRFRPHGIHGIGASFVPGILNRSVLDDIIPVRDEDATTMARRLAREEGSWASSGSQHVRGLPGRGDAAADQIVVRCCAILGALSERHLLGERP